LKYSCSNYYLMPNLSSDVFLLAHRPPLAGTTNEDAALTICSKGAEKVVIGAETAEVVETVVMVAGIGWS